MGQQEPAACNNKGACQIESSIVNVCFQYVDGGQCHVTALLAGPGLAVRVLGDVTEGDALDVLRHVDEVYVQTIRDYGLYDKIWQAFAVFLPVR